MDIYKRFFSNDDVIESLNEEEQVRQQKRMHNSV